MSPFKISLLVVMVLCFVMGIVGARKYRHESNNPSETPKQITVLEKRSYSLKVPVIERKSPTIYDDFKTIKFNGLKGFGKKDKWIDSYLLDGKEIKVTPSYGITELFCFEFEGRVSSIDVLNWCKDNGYRPATVSELIDFSEAQPVMTYITVSLGSYVNIKETRHNAYVVENMDNLGIRFRYLRTTKFVQLHEIKTHFLLVKE